VPAAELVPEQRDAPGPAAADRAFGNHATLNAVLERDGCLLDHESALWHAHLERSVVEVAGPPMLESRCHCFEDAAVQPHRMPARAER
jgi:hypothetical protein